MASDSKRRRLVVNADDFGRSRSINRAVVQAHCEGILTTASLMVNSGATQEAVELAAENPGLGVGLHLTLVCGRSSLKPTEVPGLVDERYQFSSSPFRAGLRYYLRRGLRWQLRHEIAAQVSKFKALGLKLDHLNGHLNIHLHPTIASIVEHNAQAWGIHHARLTRDRFWLNARLARGRWIYRVSHAIIFAALAAAARDAFDRAQIRYAPTVFGLLQDSNITESYLLGLIPHLPEGVSEVYCHPSLGRFRHELDALCSSKVRKMLDSEGVDLVRYQDI